MPRKSIGPKAMNAAARKREQVARDRTTVMEQYDSEWPARVCLLVLQSPRYKGVLKEAAWRQLGRINGWVSRVSRYPASGRRWLLGA
ncbi:MAG: hypothetical protein L0H73_15845 [Nitrococcus sp.]|nr:hypothetical protein [Nitrococcus sp.]